MPSIPDKELQDFLALWQKAANHPPEFVLPQAKSGLSVNITDLVSLIHKMIKTQLCDIIGHFTGEVLSQQTLHKINSTVVGLFMQLNSYGYIGCQVEYNLIAFRGHPTERGSIVPDNLYTWLLMEGIILPFEFIQKMIEQNGDRITLTLPTTSRWLSGYEIPYAGRTVFYYPEQCTFGFLEQKNER